MKKEKNIRVLKVSPGSAPEVVTLKNELSALQDAVSIEAGYRGSIEVLGMEDGVDLLLNEEGKLIGLPPNRVIFDKDIIMGTFYVVSVDDKGNLASLPDPMVEKYTAYFRDAPTLSPDDPRAQPRIEFFFGD